MYLWGGENHREDDAIVLVHSVRWRHKHRFWWVESFLVPDLEKSIIDTQRSIPLGIENTVNILVKEKKKFTLWQLQWYNLHINYEAPGSRTLAVVQRLKTEKTAKTVGLVHQNEELQLLLTKLLIWFERVDHGIFGIIMKKEVLNSIFDCYWKGSMHYGVIITIWV